MAKVSIVSRHPSHRRIELPEFDKKIRIRFGSQKEYSAPKDLEFPSIEAIRNTSNKMRMKKILIESGVKTPFWKPFDFTWAENVVAANSNIMHDDIFKLKPKFELIFKEKNHSRGEGIMFINSVDDLKAVIENGKDGYIEEVVDNHREFRVHVCDGEAFYVDEKLPREEGHTARIKNLANGYKYRNRSVSRPYPSTIKEESVKAVEALGMPFGAVDIALGQDGSVNVFEVNSAMGLRTKTAELYSQKLKEYIISQGANVINNE